MIHVPIACESSLLRVRVSFAKMIFFHSRVPRAAAQAGRAKWNAGTAHHTSEGVPRFRLFESREGERESERKIERMSEKERYATTMNINCLLIKLLRQSTCERSIYLYV